ncbi:AraC family transcriptional regulator [Psychrobacillus sp.]|uniref:AraC family transcriptional regulator n=1 Tax=Psychrobacillus sp. TaxID=1871623 RepID=UPI0028BDFF35|nr:AraC family transcriptional regulator [Psychrobacillus sp.]
MNSISIPPNTSYIFHLSQIDYITCSLNTILQNITALQHTLVIFIGNDHGKLTIDDKPYLITPFKSFLLTPGSVMDLMDSTMNKFSYYKLSFTVIQIEQQIPLTYTDKLFSNQVEYTVYPFTRFSRLAKELYKLKGNEDIQNHLKHQNLFNELLGVLLEHQHHIKDHQDTSKTVEQTIEYLHENYHQQLTISQLAILAEVPHWQYSTIFQTVTGQKPLDYLTNLRIKHAKELLQQTNEPLRNIAQQVGFNDEYYFNRRFKQVVGIPPKQFARMRKQKVIVKDWTGHEVEIPSFPRRIIYHGETFGDLLVFDVQPIGGYKTDIDKSFYKSYVPYVQDVAFPIDIEKSSKLNPDLIIFTNSDEKQYKKIAKIAPTVTHNSWGTLNERILTLGKWLGRKQEAEDWLAHFNHKENMMWQKLQSTLKNGETASVFVFDHGKRLFVMGSTGLPTSLYHPFGFQPGELIKKIIDEEEGYKEITIDLLGDYAGDRIFMLLSENLESRLATEELIKSPLWNNLPAVKNGYVYLVDATKWNSGDAFTREKLLGALPRLLGHIS